MAIICSVPFPILPKPPNHHKFCSFPPTFSSPNVYSTSNFSIRNLKSHATNSSSSSTTGIEQSVSIDVLRRFIDLNSGKWNGTFYQFDALGNLLHKIDTKLNASCYGENELMSLIQTLYIRQPAWSKDEEQEWAEYKIKESNMFTVDKYQQIGFFPDERAFALRYQTAGMLDYVLRQGVLGEDDTGEESPKNLKLPSRRPSIVCENCLYSQEKDMRARAFHIMDPQGIVEMLLIFLEERGDGLLVSPLLHETENSTIEIEPFLGTWKGHSVTNRSGVYGGTIAEADSTAIMAFDDKGQLIQDITSTSSDSNVTTNVPWTGTISKNVVTFDKGYQMILLPGGMYMGSPCNIANSLAESKSFHLEFCWLESPKKRQRLIRTFDIEGYAVSSTYISETKLKLIQSLGQKNPA